VRGGQLLGILFYMAKRKQAVRLSQWERYYKKHKETIKKIKRNRKEKKDKLKKVLSIHQLPSVPNSHFTNYKEYCKSEYFIGLKKAVLKKADYICAKCGSKANTAHHKKYRNRWSESEINDCIAVCNKCHREIHNK